MKYKGCVLLIKEQSKTRKKENITLERRKSSVTSSLSYLEKHGKGSCIDKQTIFCIHLISAAESVNPAW